MFHFKEIQMKFIFNVSWLPAKDGVGHPNATRIHILILTFCAK